VFAGEGVATHKFDRTCCLVRDGKLYKRRKLRAGEAPPANFEAADLDSETGKTVGWVPVGRAAKEVCNLIMNGEETPGLSGGLGALHDPLASSGWLMRVLRPVVQAAVLPMFDTRHDLSLGRGRAGQLVLRHRQVVGEEYTDPGSGPD
jgi:hypothetical protein